MAKVILLLWTTSLSQLPNIHNTNCFAKTAPPRHPKIIHLATSSR